MLYYRWKISIGHLLDLNCNIIWRRTPLVLSGNSEGFFLTCVFKGRSKLHLSVPWWVKFNVMWKRTSWYRLFFIINLDFETDFFFFFFSSKSGSELHYLSISRYAKLITIRKYFIDFVFFSDWFGVLIILCIFSRDEWKLHKFPSVQLYLPAIFMNPGEEEPEKCIEYLASFIRR